MTRQSHINELAAIAAVDFLEHLRPGGPWVLSAITPDGSIDTITSSDASKVIAFVSTNNGKRNLYYSVNPTRGRMNRKAAKTDISAIEYLLADLDPKSDETAEAAKARYEAALDVKKPAPTGIIDSGNGIQALWKLSKPINLRDLPPPVIDHETGIWEMSPQAKAVVDDVEGRIKALIESLGSVAGTQNIDRILRLPGTTNLPNEKKLKAGRVSCQTKLLKFNGVSHSLESFPVAATINDETSQDKSNERQKPEAIDWAKVATHAGWLKTVSDLPPDFRPKGRMIVAHGANLKHLNDDLKEAGFIEKPYDSWSAVSMALAAIFKADDRFTTEKTVAALMCKLACNQHINKIKDEDIRRRAVTRLLGRSYQPDATAHAAAAPNWRERMNNRDPKPSMHNARLAITALGIECSHDTFHETLLFGYSGDTIRHHVQFFLGEVNDNGIIALRQIISDRFGFDPTERFTRDAVISLALEHCFDPVCDMLDKAEADWDGIDRLDRMAVDYFNCEDTPLNRAFLRKTMIGAVHRARHPGCKFDTIATLESKEGYNKSSVWRDLAGAENFSDAKLFGKNDQQVQEQLATVWIHENAELAGIKKAEVEGVKAFASRQVDIGRAAYGHFPKRQKRHSIEVGSTNSEEYLQSQTGNRRFWPLKVLKPIDLELVRRDRLQLWGEAAKYESAGESVTLDEAMWPDAGIEQEKRRNKDPWEEILTYIPVSVDHHVDFNGNSTEIQSVRIVHCEADVGGFYREKVSSADLLTYVLRIPPGMQQPHHSMKLSTVMKLIGWERPASDKISINGRQARGFIRRVWGPIPVR